MEDPRDLKDRARTYNETQKKTALAKRDTSPLSIYFDEGKFDHAWKVAVVLSKAEDMIPYEFRGKPNKVFVALEMAERFNVSPFLMLQKIYVVHGRPGIESQFAIATANASGQFKGPFRYHIKKNQQGRIVSCTAIATLKDGTRVEGPEITAQMVSAEGWDRPKKRRDGSGTIPSKWTTIPELMYRYRAGAYLVRTSFPEMLLGMMTKDELEDIHEEEAMGPTTVEIVDEGPVLQDDVPHEFPSTTKPEPEKEPEPPPPEPVPEPKKAPPEHPRKEEVEKATAGQGPINNEAPSDWEEEPDPEPPKDFATVAKWRQEIGMPDEEWIKCLQKAEVRAEDKRTHTDKKLARLKMLLQMWFDTRPVEPAQGELV